MTGTGSTSTCNPWGALLAAPGVQVDGKRRDIGLGAADLTPRAFGKGASPIDIPSCNASC